jgi:hypothetical protein
LYSIRFLAEQPPLRPKRLESPFAELGSTPQDRERVSLPHQGNAFGVFFAPYHRMSKKVQKTQMHLADGLLLEGSATGLASDLNSGGCASNSIES